MVADDPATAREARVGLACLEPPAPDRKRGRVTILQSNVDPASEEFRSNERAQLELLAQLEAQLDLARAGGGERYRQRHADRGKLGARARVELLLDPDAPFLELSSLAAYGSEFAVGGALVAGLGVVSGTECMIVANDPTVRGGAINPYGMRKHLRALEIARVNRLPVLNLVESAGADLPTQADLFLPVGQLFRDLTRLSALGIPTISLVFGTSTAGGAYVPGMSDYAVLVDHGAKVFLGGPPLVKMATGEDADDEELGGALMHATISGVGDYFARDEREAIAMGRQIVASLNWRKLGPGPDREVEAPRCDPEELLGVVSSDLKVPFDPKEVIARIVDGSAFDEYKALYGTSLVCGWAHLGGFKLGILANARGVLFNEEAKKGAEGPGRYSSAVADQPDFLDGLRTVVWVHVHARDVQRLDADLFARGGRHELGRGRPSKFAVPLVWRVLGAGGWVPERQVWSNRTCAFDCWGTGSRNRGVGGPGPRLSRPGRDGGDCGRHGICFNRPIFIAGWRDLAWIWWSSRKRDRRWLDRRSRLHRRNFEWQADRGSGNPSRLGSGIQHPRDHGRPVLRDGGGVLGAGAEAPGLG